MFHVSAFEHRRIQLSKRALRFFFKHGWQAGQEQSGSRVGGRGGALSGLKLWLDTRPAECSGAEVWLCLGILRWVLTRLVAEGY